MPTQSLGLNRVASKACVVLVVTRYVFHRPYGHNHCMLNPVKAIVAIVLTPLEEPACANNTSGASVDREDVDMMQGPALASVQQHARVCRGRSWHACRLS